MLLDFLDFSEYGFREPFKPWKWTKVDDWTTGSISYGHSTDRC